MFGHHHSARSQVRNGEQFDSIQPPEVIDEHVDVPLQLEVHSNKQGAESHGAEATGGSGKKPKGFKFKLKKKAPERRRISSSSSDCQLQMQASDEVKNDSQGIVGESCPAELEERLRTKITEMEAEWEKRIGEVRRTKLELEKIKLEHKQVIDQHKATIDHYKAELNAKDEQHHKVREQRGKGQR